MKYKVRGRRRRAERGRKPHQGVSWEEICDGCGHVAICTYRHDPVEGARYPGTARENRLYWFCDECHEKQIEKAERLP